MSAAAALALVALLYHALNHAFMKSLLFLGTGAVLHATGERNLGRLGGLIHRMPWVAGLTLIGALAIAGLPPLNGFVSEWLLLQTLLFSPEVPDPSSTCCSRSARRSSRSSPRWPAYVMVKFYGVVFLGQPREPSLARAHDADWPERLGMGWLAAGCLVLGLAPAWVIGALGPRRDRAGPRGAAERAIRAVPRARAGPRGVLRAARDVRRHPRRHRADGVDSATPLPDARAARRGLGLRLRSHRCAHAGHGGGIRPADPPPVRAVLRDDARAADTFRRRAALSRDGRRPVLERALRCRSVPACERIAQGVAVLQQGRIAVYLLYSFVDAACCCWRS